MAKRGRVRERRRVGAVELAVQQEEAVVGRESVGVTEQRLLLLQRNNQQLKLRDVQYRWSCVCRFILWNDMHGCVCVCVHRQYIIHIPQALCGCLCVCVCCRKRREKLNRRD